ncbi:MAG: M28 family peptidase, partial [Anaerolineae bacterium]|nr:M28 family peptidase [Anaerolineae bacterium]
LAFALARGVAEALLWEAGLEQAWLRAGLAAHAAEFLDGVPLPNVTARYLPVALRAAARGTIPEVDALLAPEEDGAAPGTERLALAWDAARHLVERRGWEGVQALLDHLAAGQPFPQAFAAATGLPPGEFAQRWRESLARGHALPAWVTAASRFDGQAALAHVEELAGPAYAGRQPGSPGGQRAAAYIAEQFAQLGLAPAGEDGTFFQRFPISYTTFVAEPRFALLDGEGREVDALAFREDFVPLFGGTAGGGQVEAPLVWVRAEAYGEMRLGGKVVLRESDRPVQEEAAEALAHGAGGLILSRDREGPNFQAKAPLPVTAPLTETIPVVEVSAEALERIVVAGGHTLADIRTSPPAMPLPIRVRLEVPLSPPVAAWGANVLGALPGRDPARQHEWVILGAHYDHVGDDPAPGRRYPGANDNASGVAVLLEIARLWREAGYWPSRSVLFAAWDAQEPGQVGSSFYVAHPTVPLTDTVAMWQLDAVGGSRTGYYLQAQGDRANAGENLCLSLVDAAAKQVEGRLDVARPLGQSDEHPFREAQIPALLFVWKGADE